MAERPEDLNLPAAVVSRIIKDALPPSTKVSKEAQQAIAKAASVFVLYATSCSNQIADRSNRKTIHGQDVIEAMEDMEFDKFVKPLETSLDGWKQSQQKKKDAAKRKAEEKKDSPNKNKTSKQKEEPEENKENEDDDDDDVKEVTEETT